jgi:hypothetical protein
VTPNLHARYWREGQWRGFGSCMFGSGAGKREPGIVAMVNEVKGGCLGEDVLEGESPMWDPTFGGFGLRG